jgi:CheY-like chemotaxis protein
LTRILVVDDDADTRWLLCDLLERHEGWEAVGRPDAYQALFDLRHDHFDVLVLDHMMPGATGLDLVARLADADIDVPVVLVTSLVPGPVSEDAQELGVVAVVSKETVGADLAGAVERAANRRRADRGGAGE